MEEGEKEEEGGNERKKGKGKNWTLIQEAWACLLYTSDAADE